MVILTAFSMARPETRTIRTIISIFITGPQSVIVSNHHLYGMRLQSTRTAI